MDDDLAFCLGQFIDEQVKLIDDRIDRIQEEEIEECKKIEAAQRDFERRRPPAKDKGSHTRDQALVDQFIEDLREHGDKAATRTVFDDAQAVDTLRAEIRTKLGACTSYIDRLRTLARQAPNTRKFCDDCIAAMDYCRRNETFEENFNKLTAALQDSDDQNVVKNVQQWWKETYGTKIEDLNRRNQKLNPAITEPGFVIVSPTSRIMAYSKRVLNDRRVVEEEAPKVAIIRTFVEQLLLLDDERRATVNAEELIERLINSNVDEGISYAQKWLNQRDEIRNQKEEENPYDAKLGEAKAEYGRRRIAQETKKLAVAALLCRLAVGSGKDAQFEQQFNKTVQKQNQNSKENIAVISGDIKNPDAEDLPFVVRLIVQGDSMQPWVDDDNNIRERFGANLCKAFGIPDKKLRIKGVDGEQGLIYFVALPPHGKKVADGLNGNAPDAAERMAAVRQCCVDIRANIESITLGGFDLNVENKLMDPRWNKNYIWPDQDPKEGIHWGKPIDQGGKPYYCPCGWKRYSVKVAEDQHEFDAKWKHWHVAYHGTRGEFASNILTSGLRVSTQGCFYEEGIPRVYVSPSIEYSAHPRYAFPWKRTQKDGQVIWYQLVFQCRVNPASVKMIGPETLVHDEYKQTVTVDSNFDNGELEWIILGERGVQYIKDDIICYGIMMRASTVDPATLTPSAWWKHSYHSDIYKKKA